MLNSTEILAEGIVTKVNNTSCIQQVGIDLEVDEIKFLTGVGRIGVDGTQLPVYEPVKPAWTNGPNPKKSWLLEPGVYDLTFNQGCNIPKDVTLLLRQRSSLARSGAFIHSSIFDPGFETANMGTLMTVHRHIIIERGARVCQAYAHRNTPVADDKLYNGQFQNDKQRT